VHRGTPWQTINFKGFAQEGNFDDWKKQARLAYMPETHPTNDWRLVDLFTAALHPSATRGQLSINQTNLAAWSAVLSGIGVTSLGEDQDQNPFRTNLLVEPFANGSPIPAIIAGIGRRKASTPLKQFFRLSEFVSTPELTSKSPYLLPPVIPQSAASPYAQKRFLTDLDYERIPDDILSLVKVGDVRFVVYAYGQSLKPAPNLPDYPSIVTTGPHAGMCINYQITGETAARAVIRVDFDRIMDPASPFYLKPDYRRPHAVVESFNVLTP
jgi:hypothetical protein